jgi:hypothetical protein
MHPKQREYLSILHTECLENVLFGSRILERKQRAKQMQELESLEDECCARCGPKVRGMNRKFLFDARSLG